MMLANQLLMQSVAGNGSKSIGSAILTFLAWTSKMDMRPRDQEAPPMRRSSRPGRNSAGRGHQGGWLQLRAHALTAVETIHFSEELIQGLLPLIVSREPTIPSFSSMVSISSINTIHGAFSVFA